MLFFAIMQNILLIIIQFIAVLFAISIHEAAHALMAYRFGDPTAKSQGRITLNPIAHIDPIGTVIFPILLAIMGAPVFGWAKPVMVNPYNLRNPKRDGMYISAAGPISNILVSISGIFIFIILKNLKIISAIDMIKFLFYDPSFNPGAIALILFYLIIINIFLAVFNLIPIPPLDGSGIIEGVLKGDSLIAYQKIRPYGFIILLVIIYLGVLDFIARPILRIVVSVLLG